MLLSGESCRAFDLSDPLDHFRQKSKSRQAKGLGHTEPQRDAAEKISSRRPSIDITGSSQKKTLGPLGMAEQNCTHKTEVLVFRVQQKTTDRADSYVWVDREGADRERTGLVANESGRRNNTFDGRKGRADGDAAAGRIRDVKRTSDRKHKHETFKKERVENHRYNQSSKRNGECPNDMAMGFIAERVGKILPNYARKGYGSMIYADRAGGQNRTKEMMMWGF